MSSVSESTMVALVEQLRITEGRLRDAAKRLLATEELVIRQGARLSGCAEDLRRVRTLHVEIYGAVAALGVDLGTMERANQAVAEVSIVLESVETTLRDEAATSMASVGAELSHGLTAWRRAIDRTLTSTQPIDPSGLREIAEEPHSDRPKVHEWPVMPGRPDDDEDR